ncbi:hypothetical protein FRC04_005701 [Tulasnella sp. 424]|nr:hypothetical protein FRC04_005701 [Tulasnella sp. 424]
MNESNQATSKSDSMTQQSPSRLLSVPPELHEHISIFLPTSSIPGLIMTNQQLRSIYEKILYRHINLYAQPHRSNALLRTFTLRPDLALLVRSLDIDLRWSEVNTLSGQLSISPAHPARLGALASMRNINSFGLSGVGWLWGEGMKDIQDVVSKMRLTSLRIHEWWAIHSEPDLRYKAGVYANLRAVLQGQPRLLNLELKYFLFKMEAARGVQIPIGIQSSDIAGLRTLNAEAYTVASILPAIGDQLESLEMHNWKGKNTDLLTTSFSSFTAATGGVRKLHLSMQWIYNSGWDFDFGPTLELFPNVESLRIIGVTTVSPLDQPMLLGAYYEKVAAQITHSPNLSKLEMSLKFGHLATRKLDGVDNINDEFIHNLKRSCPSLKAFVDLAEQEWVFLPTEEEGGSNAFQAMKCVYEQILYRHINLCAKPYRSLGLLRTFASRPDLALLVQSLDIDLGWYEDELVTKFENTSPATGLSRINALALAQNIKSLGISGVAWLWGDEMKRIQEIVSEMKLTALRIHESWPRAYTNQKMKQKKEAFVNLDILLQGQPLIQDLGLEYFLLKLTPKSDASQIGIRNSDIPSLRNLRGEAATVALILPVAGEQLDSLEMHNWFGSNNKYFPIPSFSKLPAATERVRKLHLSMRWTYELGWDFDFGRLLELFPNVESLRITGFPNYPSAPQPILFERFFEKVASQITRSPNLTKLEASFDFELEPELNLLIDAREDLRLDLKRSCPSLTTFIDPAEQEWVFVAADKEGGSKALRAMKLAQLYQNYACFRSGDLIGLEWDV